MQVKANEDLLLFFGALLSIKTSVLLDPERGTQRPREQVAETDSRLWLYQLSQRSPD